MVLVGFAVAVAVHAQSTSDAGAPPSWAYVVSPLETKKIVDEGAERHVPDSDVTYTFAQVNDLFFAPDWHPADHPQPPDIVTDGRKPDVFACGYCHRIDGSGGPENAGIAGLPKDYILQQLAAFKDGSRGTSVPGRLPPRLSRSITAAEADAAAAYFSALRPKPIISVVEADTVPATQAVAWHLATAEGGEREPIGQRLIELPRNLERFTNRDSRVEFVTYVPPGATVRGKALAYSREGGAHAPCDSCHGQGLAGSGLAPGIAGRSPSYLVRQLYDFQSGARSGPGSAPMQPVVAKLTVEDMIDLAAFAASLTPSTRHASSKQHRH
jgi:cytochrome c553